MVRPSGKAPGREQIMVTEDAVDDTFHKRYDSYVPDDDIDEEVAEGRDDAPATRHQIADAVSVYSLQSCPARAESALISSKKSKAASSVTSRQSRAVTIKVDNRACNSGIQQNWHELDDDSSSAAASRHQDVTHILSGLSSLTSDCSSAVASAKSPKSIRSVFSKRSHSSVPSVASGSNRRSYPTTKSTPSVTSRQSTSSSAAASRQHDATSIISGSASPTLDCSSEVASAKSRKSTRSAFSEKSHGLPSAASISSRRSYSTTKSTPSATSRQSTALAVNELGDSSSAAASHQHDATSIRSESNSPAKDCNSEVASVKSRKSMQSMFSKRSRNSVPSVASGSSREAFPDTQSCSGFFVSEGVSDCSSEEGRIIPTSVSSRQSTAVAANELGNSSSAAASHHQEATSIRSGSASPALDYNSEVASAKSHKSTRSVFSKRSRVSLPSAASVSSRRSYPTTKSTPSATSRQSTSSSAAASRHQDATSIMSGSASPALDCSSEVASAKSRKSARSVLSKRSHCSVPSVASGSSRRSYPTTKSTPSVSSRQSTAVAANELADSSSAAARRQQDATSIRSVSASPTPDCSLQVASTSANSHISIPSVVSTGSRSRKSNSSNKSSINSKFEMKLPDVIAEEGDKEDNNNTDIVSRHAASVSSRRSCSTAKSTPSSRQSRVIAAAEDSRACSSGLKQDWHELGDSSPAAASRKQAEETSILSGLSSLTSYCSSEEASTSAKSRKSMRSVFSKGSRSRKSKSSKKSSIKSKLEMKVTPTITAEEGENDDDIVDIVTHRSNHSAKKEPSSTSSNHQVPKQHDLEFWSTLAVRVAMAVMRAKGTEKMAQRASNMVLQEGQRHCGREHSREMMSLLSAKLSMAILEAGGDGKVASAAMIAVMMASDNNQDVISMLSDNNSTDQSIVPSVASTVQSDRLKPTERDSITTSSPKGSTKGSTTAKSKEKKKKTSQANQSPKEANQSPSREETVSASLSVGSSTSALKRSQLESIQKEMDEKKRQLESLEMEVENAKKRATEEAERLLKTEMNSSIQPDRSKLDYILKEREQKQQQLQITRNEIEAKKRAAKEAMRLEYMLMEFEKRKKALEEEELRNCLKRAENVLHQELAKINSDLGKVGERDADKTSPFMDLIWNACGIAFSGDPGDPCGTVQGEESLYTDDWTTPSSMSFDHQPSL